MAIKHITFDDSASMSYTVLSGAYQTLITMTDDADVLFIWNSTDAAIALSVPNGAGSTKDLKMPKQSTMTIDCRSNSKRLAKGVIRVRATGALASTGEVIATVAR